MDSLILVSRFSLNCNGQSVFDSGHELEFNVWCARSVAFIRCNRCTQVRDFTCLFWKVWKMRKPQVRAPLVGLLLRSTANSSLNRWSDDDLAMVGFFSVHAFICDDRQIGTTSDIKLIVWRPCVSDRPRIWTRQNDQFGWVSQSTNNIGTYICKISSFKRCKQNPMVKPF